MMKMLSYLVTESKTLKIGKRQKYIYVTDIFYISWGPGADVRDMLGSKSDVTWSHLWANWPTVLLCLF